MKALTAADWTILEFLSPDPRPIRELLGVHPKPTIYRHLATLQRRGIVVKHGREYALTAAGEQAKADREAGTLGEGLVGFYPPLHEVPTPQHRALLELALGALALRQHADQEERHAGFLLMGPTLTWKTSAGRFLCLAAGADPATCIVDLATESGKSLWIRRGPTGDIVAQRTLLEAPVVVLDEYQFADQAVRRAVAPFLSGRRRVPAENTIIEISPVPLVTLNPSPGDTLAARTSFSVPQLRRLVPCDLAAVQLPDLALEGGCAIEAARRAGPLPLRAPRGSCESFRPAVVRLLRQTLAPEVVGLVDVELLLGLGTGLTAWLPSAAAMRQTLFDFLLIVETVGWVRPGWVGPLRAFPAGGGDDYEPQGADRKGPERASPITPSPGICLFPEQTDPRNRKENPSMNTRDSMMPPFHISDATKAQVIWVSQDAGVSVEQAFQVLVNIYRLQQSEGFDFDHLRAIVGLRDECDAHKVSVEDLRQYLELATELQEQRVSVGDLQAALKVADDLAAAGLSLEQAAGVADLLNALNEAGVTPTLIEDLRQARDRYQSLGYSLDIVTRLADLQARLEALGLTPDDHAQWLEHLKRLRALGLDSDTAERLAIALRAAGLDGERRDEVLQRLVESATIQIELEELRQQQRTLEREMDRLKADRDQLQQALTVLQDAVAQASRQKEDLSRQVTALKQEARELADAVAVAKALQNFLLGNTKLTHPFWKHVGWLRGLKDKFPAGFPLVEDILTTSLQNQILEFLAKIVAMRQKASSTQNPQGQTTDPAGGAG